MQGMKSNCCYTSCACLRVAGLNMRGESCLSQGAAMAQMHEHHVACNLLIRSLQNINLSLTNLPFLSMRACSPLYHIACRGMSPRLHTGSWRCCRVTHSAK